MSETNCEFRELLPQQGELYQEETVGPVLCKPKLLPLKSVTLEKLEKMQHDAQETVKKEEADNLQQKLQEESSMYMANDTRNDTPADVLIM